MVGHIFPKYRVGTIEIALHFCFCESRVNRTLSKSYCSGIRRAKAQPKQRPLIVRPNYWHQTVAPLVAWPYQYNVAQWLCYRLVPVSWSPTFSVAVVAMWLQHCIWDANVLKMAIDRHRHRVHVIWAPQQITTTTTTIIFTICITIWHWVITITIISRTICIVTMTATAIRADSWTITVFAAMVSSNNLIFFVSWEIQTVFKERRTKFIYISLAHSFGES